MHADADRRADRLDVPMSRSLALALAMTASLALAACTPDGAPLAAPPAPGAPPPAVILPTADVPRITRSEGSTTTVVSADGRSTSTTSTSTSVSVDPGALLAALSGGAAPAAAPVNTAADYVGAWNVSNARNPQCRFILQPVQGLNPGFAQNQGCFGDPLFGISRWSLRGTELVLSDAFGRVSIGLRATGPNRLDGGGVTMWR